MKAKIFKSSEGDVQDFGNMKLKNMLNDPECPTALIGSKEPVTKLGRAMRLSVMCRSTSWMATAPPLLMARKLK